jgi:hypothetical protein
MLNVKRWGSVLKQRGAAWVALFAIILHALAPSFSHAVVTFSNTQSNIWVEICSSLGSKWIAAEPLNTTGSETNFQHCPYCVTPSNSAVLPTSYVSWIPQLEDYAAANNVLQYFLHSDVWPTALARAPPVFS